MERKELLKRLGSYTLTLSLITGSSSILSGCVSVKYKNKDDSYHCLVVLNNNNAIIYDTSINDISFTMQSNFAIIHEDGKSITLIDYIAFDNYTKDEVEEKVKDLIGEDGNITYYGLDKEKKLKKIR